MRVVYIGGRGVLACANKITGLFQLTFSEVKSED